MVLFEGVKKRSKKEKLLFISITFSLKIQEKFPSPLFPWKMKNQ